MILTETFWSGSDPHDRRVVYFEEYNARKELIEHNAAEVMSRVQLLVDIFEADTGIKLPGRYSSGWRPKSVNEVTANSGAKSNHIDAAAGDVEDTPDGNFAWWCFHHQELLQKCGLWLEHPCATVLNRNTPWCHLQIVPPKSGARVFFPTSSSALLWEAFLASGEKARGDLWA